MLVSASTVFMIERARVYTRRASPLCRGRYDQWFYYKLPRLNLNRWHLQIHRKTMFSRKLMYYALIVPLLMIDKLSINELFQNNFGRLNDRSKETPETVKQLNRLFPNKMTIQIPQDETVLSDWKKQLDRDT